MIRIVLCACLSLVLLAQCAGPPTPLPTSTVAVAPTTAVAPEVRIGDLHPNAERIDRYEKFELTFDVHSAAVNLFDPAHIDVEGHFTAPDGQVTTVPGFYWQDYTSSLSNAHEVLTPKGAPAWKVRFTPWQTGTWHYTVSVKTLSGNANSPVKSFQAVRSERHGFIHGSKQNPTYLSFDDGTPYTAIGANVAWYGKGGTYDYERWLGRMSDSGANFARVWMPSWAMGIEWSDTGLGDYTRRLDKAWQLDRVFELSEQHGIFLMLTLLNHGAFSAGSNPEWDSNPYNASVGGPCAKPECFASDPQARYLFKIRLRYIAARWGYSPSLLAWEWWNEVDWTPLGPAQIQTAWIKEMSSYLKTVDPYAHVRTTSYAFAGDAAVWELPEIDLVQRHIYNSADPSVSFVAAANTMRTFGKPVLVGEFGYSADLTDSTSLDQKGLHVHNGLWAGLMSGGFGTGMSWWWDSYIDPLDLYGQFVGPAAFMRNEDLAAHDYRPYQVHVNRADARALMLFTPDRVLGWVKDNSASYMGLQQQYAIAKENEGVAKLTAANFVPEFSIISGATISLTGVTPGTCTVEWWDTHSGQIITTTRVATNNRSLQLELPQFTEDLAFKLSCMTVQGGQPSRPGT